MKTNNQSNIQFLAVLAFVFFGLSSQILAQIPTIKNRATGKVILLRPVGAKVVSPSNASQVASKTYNLSNGGTQTVKLLKGNNSVPFLPRVVRSTPSTQGNTVCTEKQVNGELGGIDASNLSPATQAIYPGSIIDGLTIPSGEYRQITADRNPIVLSMSSNANGISATESVDQPSVANVRTAVDKMLQGKQTTFTPEAREDRTLVVRSQEDINLALNVHTKAFLVSSVDFSSQLTTSAKEVTFIRILKDRFFSVDVVPPTEDKDFFENEATVISPNWTYISSMKYGRLGVLAITVRTKEREMTAELEASYRAIFASANGTFSTEIRNKTEHVEIKAFNLGGSPLNVSANSAAEVPAAIQKFNNWVNTGATRPMPFTYTLNFVKYENGGPAVASINSVLSYTQRTCRTLQPRYEVTFKEVRCVKANDSDGGAGEDITSYCWAGAYKSGNQEIVPLFGKPALIWRRIDCGQSIRGGTSYQIPDGLRYYDVNPTDRDARINIGGDLDDDDNCGIGTGTDDEFDDLNGERTRKDIFFRDIGTTPMTVVFDHKSGGSHVQQIWTLRKTFVD